jgi:hypothetical protein
MVSWSWTTFLSIEEADNDDGLSVIYAGRILTVAAAAGRGVTAAGRR